LPPFGMMTAKKREITIFPITERGARLGARLSGLKGKVRLYAPRDLRSGRLKSLVQNAFSDSTALVFIGAAGIAVRSIAPFIKGKEKDPAVVVMDEKARFVLSLLSGHLGGANRLASEIASLIGATPVVTTATDINNLPCIEDLALRFNLAIENPRAIKHLNSAILSGGPVLIIDSRMDRLRAMREFMNKRVKGIFLFKSSLPASIKAEAAAIISPRLNVTLPPGPRTRALILRPREFVVGLGCRRDTPESAIKKAVDSALKSRGISPLAVGSLATIDIKASEKGLTGFAKSRGLEIDFYSADELNKMATKKSAFVMRTTGARGVSEPAALLSSGAKRLWMKKQKSLRVTVAVAKADFTS